MKLMIMQEFGRSRAQLARTRAERTRARRAAYAKRQTRLLQKLQRERARAERRRRTWLTRLLTRGALAGAAACWILLGGADPLVTGALSARLAAPPTGEAVAALEPATQVALVDANGDGSIDLASPTSGEVRGHDAYGSGFYGASRDRGRRKHAGCDFVAQRGDPVHAPIGGVVTRVGHSYDDDKTLTFVEIEDAAAQMRARVHYVDAAVFPGQILLPGETIGSAQDLSRRYPGGMTNHVHVELTSTSGLRFDPARMLPKPPQREARLAPRLSGPARS